MSLEAKIDALIVALEANTAARQGDKATGSAGTAKAGAADKKAADKKPAKPKASVEQVKTAVMSVKDTIDSETAKGLIEKYAGDGEKLAKLLTLPEHFDAVVAEAKELLEAAGGDEAEDEDDI